MRTRLAPTAHMLLSPSSCVRYVYGQLYPNQTTLKRFYRSYFKLEVLTLPYNNIKDNFEHFCTATLRNGMTLSAYEFITELSNDEDEDYELPSESESEPKEEYVMHSRTIALDELTGL
ncbi:hypothetical protein CC78DRAFT_586688 [Lojkania enalia]|uniref:Uncharacterized protein n=1 Tax=Lojkania enalia TaxID=147567 RepID=A0A9P4JXM0_9PLEO|nr:hypothetical protein CC78DRAFT_586688 [Didymosphaeria enalia]